jgi:hypothetical protein
VIISSIFSRVICVNEEGKYKYNIIYPNKLERCHIPRHILLQKSAIWCSKCANTGHIGPIPPCIVRQFWSLSSGIPPPVLHPFCIAHPNRIT